MQLHWEIVQTLDPEHPHFIQLLTLQVAALSQSVPAGRFKLSWEVDSKTTQNQYKSIHLLCRDGIKSSCTFN